MWHSCSQADLSVIDKMTPEFSPTSPVGGVILPVALNLGSMNALP
jgi:hypothetical protein